MNEAIEAVRRFNRFYTQKAGLLEHSFMGSGLTLTECRVIFELSNRDGRVAVDIIAALALDAGYLSRILRRFERDGLLSRAADPADRRRQILKLTTRGRRLLEKLNAMARRETDAMLRSLTPGKRQHLLAAMATIEATLSATPADIILRRQRVGDLGTVIARQSELYARELGWDLTYEALAAKILSEFVMRGDDTRERAWIAECAGDIVGSVYLMRETEDTARLRLLYVDAATRGQGLGGRLVSACTDFAREAGYRRIVLWTQSILEPARRIYASQGYRLVRSEPHHSFGKDLVGETWELIL
ncbi:MAG: helix-turn-helix domain-containing GNAT family N-acetyltransferase [Proteobacteria bacterium]|nr:helix-turn-helix domain-containing GNAT family N-acetyltransferase [Pseudomonadota bacterium]